MGLRRQREMTTLQAGRDAVACSWTPLPARATRGSARVRDPLQSRACNGAVFHTQSDEPRLRILSQIGFRRAFGR